MKVIGLTGGTGSGKSVVASLLSQMGAQIIDADEVAHNIILRGKPAYYELVEFFGGSILDENGEIIRKKLGEIVFSDDKEKLQFLNQCTHKYIYMELKNELKNYNIENKLVVVIDAPLLLEGNFKDLCDEIWVVYADEKTRLARIVARDSISEEYGKSRMSSQITWDEYKKNADVIIYNNGDMEQLREQIIQNYKVN